MPTNAPRESPKRVLLVDDDHLTLKVTEKILAAAGYSIRCADSEHKAIEVFGEFVPHVVVTDLFMSGRSGLDLLRRVRVLAPGTPIIIITGRVDLKYVAEALRSGAYNYVQKPIQPGLLCAMVERAIDFAQGRETRSLAPRALLVDENVAEAAIVHAALVECGFQVTPAGSVEEAEPHLTLPDLTLVVTETHFARGSGVMLIRTVKTLRPEVPVMVVTGREDVRTAISCLRGGAFDLMLKPVDEKTFRAAVTRSLEHFQLASAERQLVADRQQYEQSLEQLAQNLENVLLEMSGELSRQKQILDGVAGLVQTSLVVAGSDGQVQLINSPAVDLLGLSEAELAAMSLNDTPRLAPLVTAALTGDPGDQAAGAVTIAGPDEKSRRISYVRRWVRGAHDGERTAVLLLS